MQHEIVYFLKAQRLPIFKIGMTHRSLQGGGLNKRRKEIQSMSPIKLHFVGAIGTINAERLEQEFHDIFEPARIWGEWFEFDHEDAAMLKRCFINKRKDNHTSFDSPKFKKFWSSRMKLYVQKQND